MHKGRLEAFSDGVFAIIITIMVLELKVPHGADLAALAPLMPVFLSYILSFAYVGIYWNNHHHLFQAVKHIRGAALWAAESALAKAIGSDFKGKISVVIYAAGLALTFFSPWLGVALYTAVALLWLCPDRRIEKTLTE